jgi:uncharacterized protein (TIGR00725 family)
LIEPKAVAVFGSSQTRPGSREWAEAEDAGRRIAGAGLAVVTGGYGGTMEAVSLGASRVGGEVIGVTAPNLFAHRTGANRHVTREIEAVTLTERIQILTDLAAGALVLPGSIGTAAELVIVWNLNHIARTNGTERLPTVAVGRVWSGLRDLLVTGSGADGEDIHLAAGCEEALIWLLSQPELS